MTTRTVEDGGDVRNSVHPVSEKLLELVGSRGPWQMPLKDVGSANGCPSQLLKDRRRYPDLSRD